MVSRSSLKQHFYLHTTVPSHLGHTLQELTHFKLSSLSPHFERGKPIVILAKKQWG